MIKTYFSKVSKNPYLLSGAFVALMLVIYVLAMMFDGTFFTIDEKFPFLLASFISFLMALSCALITLGATNVDSHLGKSIAAYILTVVVTGGIAFLLSGEEGFNGFKRIYTVISFGFLVIISILSAIKQVVLYAEREEWNEPKKNKNLRR